MKRVAFVLVPALCVAGGCGGDDDSADTGGVASNLAPSQISVATVAPPETPDLCDTATVTVTVAESEGPEQIVEFVNEDTQECEVDISATESADEDMEPSVRLAPGEVGFALVAPLDGCPGGDGAPHDDLEFDVNGKAVVVAMPDPSPCGFEVFAFYTD